MAGAVGGLIVKGKPIYFSYRLAYDDIAAFKAGFERLTSARQAA